MKTQKRTFIERPFLYFGFQKVFEALDEAVVFESIRENVKMVG